MRGVFGKATAWACATVTLVPGHLVGQEGEVASVLRYESLNGNIRGEVHMLPPVTTGPMSPTWSPDGRWIAFAMAGDIWRVAADGGAAEQLTHGPWYHFEPAWSPTGTHIAMTVETGEGLDLGLLSLEDGRSTVLAPHPGVDAQPAWGPEGRFVYFTSAREGSLDVHRVDLETGSVEAVADGRGNQIQPRVSPLGDLAYVAPAPGVSGSGALWRMPMAGGAPVLIHAEETAYRARPDWLPDGSALLFVSDEAGTNDLAMVGRDGGNVLRLTGGDTHELTPAVSPDGARIAFVSDERGVTTLNTMDVGGGAVTSWTRIATTERVYRNPMGRLAGRIVDADGAPLAARVSVVASDGRAYAPRGSFHKVIAATETHFFRTTGDFVVEVPAGPVTVSVRKGLEYEPAERTVDVDGGGGAIVELELERLVDGPARGWYGGDTHTHDLHQGRVPLSRDSFFDQLVAEDLAVSIALIHMDGTRLMGRWEDLTGRPSPLSTDTHKLQYSQEFRGSFGHVGLLGVSRFVMPLIGGAANTPFAADVLNADYLEAAREQGGIGGFMHPFTGSVQTPRDVSASEIPVDAALGAGEFYDVICYWYDELANAEIYYRLLNAGFRIAATGGTDNFSDVWRDPGPGASRTYARVDGELTVDAWIDAIRDRRTFATNGPLLFTTVDGVEPGGVIAVSGEGPRRYAVDVEVSSIAEVARVEILVNGEVVAREETGSRTGTFRIQEDVELAGSGWIAVRALGPASPLVSDSYAFAQTTPVWIEADGEPFVSNEDVTFLLAAVEAFKARVVERDRWTTEADRARFLARVDSAAAVYRGLLNGSR